MSNSIQGSLTQSNLDALNNISNNRENTRKLKNRTLGKDAYLKLMATQLATQNPLEPLDNKEMISQMAQFTSVEQLGNMSKYMEKSVSQNDLILGALINMNEGSEFNMNLANKIDQLIESTDRNSEINMDILEELRNMINSKKADEAYE